ncbi:Diphthine methyltransferase [Nosema granulosis]|uniref:Diphthine methyltransferase n=1 Tax=Nosema granulosis TaxID=83296 RepID=A0A9P6GZ43_9MICR|nr:Diphthine methyltransferase [Nosema granulosis]
MKIYNLNENVDVIVSYEDAVYFGSYDLEEGNKYGKIIKIRTKDLVERDPPDLEIDTSTPTTGTFDIIIWGSSLVSANTKDISLYDKDLNLLQNTHTTSYNTFLASDGDFLFVSDGDGYITVYNDNLEKTICSKVSSDTLWVVGVHDGCVYCGGEEGVLYILKKSNLSVIDTINTGCGITSLYFEDGFFLLGSYDEHIYHIEYDLKIIKKTKIGGGVWRIIKKEHQYVLSCMYEGVKIVDSDLNILSTLETGPLIYSLALIDDYVVFNTFYDRKLYLI